MASRRAASTASTSRSAFITTRAPAAAAADGRLHDQREADLCGTLHQVSLIQLVVGKLGILGHRVPGLLDSVHGLYFVTQRSSHVRAGTDECNPFLCAALGKVGFFGQKAVTGVDRVDAKLFGDGQDFFSIAVAVRRMQLHSLVGQPHVQRIAIGYRVQRHGRNPHLPAGANDAYGNFAAVRNQ